MNEIIIVVALILLLWLLLNTRKKEKNSRVNKEEEVQTTTKRKKNKKKCNYISLFVSNSDIKARSGKLVNIRPEYHEKVSKIIHVTGKNKITIFSYIDNVLSNHFEEFEEEIIKYYRDKNKDIF